MPAGLSSQASRDYQLTLTNFLERARRFFPRQEIVSRGAQGISRYNYRQFYRRVCQLDNTLSALGVGQGDRVGSFAWNTHRHLELYFGLPCMGAVMHTVNIRLSSEQIAYVINHAQDKLLFIDEDLLPAIECVAAELPDIRQYVIMCEGKLPPTSLAPVCSYEELLAEAPENYDFPQLDEGLPAGLAYTSGTTGDPKGVIYTHRMLFLHSFALALAGGFGISEADTTMALVPMFHANAWGIPYTSTMVGAKQVLPGPHPQPEEIAGLIQTERVSFAAGVPTVWIGLLQFLERQDYDLSSLQQIVCGGSAVPLSLIKAYRDKLGLQIHQAWGMTEMSPAGSVGILKRSMSDWPAEQQLVQQAKQGLLLPGLEMRVLDESGREVPWDGESSGELLVRGPWVAHEYYCDPEASAQRFAGGWLRTGDVVTVDREGYLQIVDRTKDLVKSGGEWISSVALENALMAHPQVLEAAVIAVPNERWSERPLAYVVLKPDQQLSAEELLGSITAQFPKFWLPDEVTFIDELPKTGVGKFNKRALRQLAQQRPRR